MSPATESLLLALRRLGDHAQAQPLNGARTRHLTALVRNEESRWISVGCPDCPPEPKGSAVVFTCGGGR